MTKELKACFRCAKAGVLEPQLDKKTFAVWCSGCGASTSVDSKEEVTRQWNEGEAELYD